MNIDVLEAKEALDKILRKGRIHLYKPIQIAEILYHSCNKFAPMNIEELDTFRNASKKWRDSISGRIVGGKSTSSARFQDNLFDENAMPTKLLKALDKENTQKNGIVENYIYHGIKKRLQDVTDAYNYLANSSPKIFGFFRTQARIKAKCGQGVCNCRLCPVFDIGR
jgi:hypothetical protein